MILSILLTILKIIGIVILAVLGLLVLLLLIVLLTPFRLNVKARYDEDIRARIHVSWLLRAVHVKFEWLKDHGLLRAKLLGIKTLVKKHVGDWGPQPAQPQAAPSGDAASSAARPDAAKAGASSETKPDTAANQPSSGPKPSSEAKPGGTGKAEEKTEQASAPADPAAAGSKNDEDAKEKAAGEELPRLAAIDKKLAEIAGKLDEIQGYWYDEKNRKTLRLVGKQLKKIGRHLKPTHFLLEGELGFDDPAATGKVLGTLYSFYALFGEHVRIRGNYEEPVAKLRLELKGRLRLGVFVGAAIRLYMDKNLRSWFKKLTHKNEDGDSAEETTAEAADREQKAA